MFLFLFSVEMTDTASTVDVSKKQDKFYEIANSRSSVQYTPGIFLSAVVSPHPNNPDKFVYTVCLPDYLDECYDETVTIVHDSIKPLNTRRYSLLLPGDYYDHDMDEVVARLDEGIWSLGIFVKSKHQIWRGDRDVRDGSSDRPFPSVTNRFADVCQYLLDGGWAPASRVTYRVRKNIEYPASIHYVENKYTLKGPESFVRKEPPPDDNFKVPCVLHGDWNEKQQMFYVHAVELVAPKAMDLSPRRIYTDPEDIQKHINDCPSWIVTMPWTKTDKIVHHTDGLDDDKPEPKAPSGHVLVPKSYRYMTLGATIPVRWMHEYQALSYLAM